MTPTSATDGPHPLLVLVHGDPGVVDVYDDLAPFGPTGHDVLVEVARTGLLGRALGDDPPERGVEGLLDPTVDVAARVRRHAAFADPWLPAAEGPTPVAALLAGLRRLRQVPGPHRGVVALVRIDDGVALREVLANADRVALAWDLADPPGQAWDALADVLDEEDVLVPGAWSGLHPYVHPRRPVAERRRVAWRGLLDDFSELLEAPCPRSPRPGASSG